jgi:GH25 family lysozyme M1 (1,4-beta-N-acetylmuramidase)
MITTFNPLADAGVASAEGLDVSNFQGQFNWAGAKGQIPGLAFGIFRLTEGLPSSGDNSPDPDAAWNHDQIADQGLIRGAYHFLHPSLSGKAQADYFVSEYSKLGFHAAPVDMFWLDNEVTDGLGPAQVAACAQDFMAELKVLRPHNPQGVYTFISFANSGYNAGLGRYPLWLAFPNATAPQAPPPWAKWTFWQWGARSGTDADAFNGTAADLNAWIASFIPPSPPSGPPYAHYFNGETIGAAAASRHMTLEDWLAAQVRLARPNDIAWNLSWIANVRPPKNTRWWTINP